MSLHAREAMLHRSRQALLWSALAAYGLLLLPRLLSAGMFVDGVTYASIARNMAQHYGSFWRPYYTSTVYPVFYEHPPLGFWLQAWAYRFWGDSVYVEALWGLSTGILSLLGLGGIWSCQASPDQRRAGAWLPIAVYTLFPMTSWIFSNNLLENTMTVFIIAAVYLCMVSLTCSYTSVSCLCGVLAGCAMTCAFLVKGPVSLFPLAVPVLWSLNTEKTPGKILPTGGLMLAALAFSATCILSSDSAAIDFFKRYLAQQVYASLAGQRDMSASPFHVAKMVSREVLVPLLGGGMLTVVLSVARRQCVHGSQNSIAWKHKAFPLAKLARQLRYAVLSRLGNTTLPRLEYRTIDTRRLLYYLGIALAGSVPLIISVKQRRWYVFPALPFYALTIAVLFNQAACVLEDLVSSKPSIRRYLAISAVTLLGVACFVMLLAKDSPQRDKDFYHDFFTQPLHIDERETISVSPPSLSTHWTLVANMQRRFKASLTAEVGHTYLLTTVEHFDTVNTLLPYRKIHPPAPAKYLMLKMDN